jgi:lysyl-tRNA synthetase class 2
MTNRTTDETTDPMNRPDDETRNLETRNDLPAMLKARASLLRRVRRFFDDAGFIEVQPPCLSADQVVDAHIDPVEIDAAALLLPDDITAARYYLQTSPEFAMKRLLSLGSGSIYSLGPVFRAGERSSRHNIEFTMLEWYDVGGTMDTVIGQTIDLVTGTIPVAPPTVVSYRDLFRGYLGFDPIEAPLATLHDAVATVDPHLADSIREGRDEMLDVLMTETIEPLVGDQSLLIRNYPLTQAALARQSDDDRQTAERFEWMIGGLELANGYGELLDADELIKRNHQSNAKRIATGRQPLPVDSRLIAAMRRGTPPCSGVALGFDRLLMIEQNTKDIGDVIPFPIEIA